MKHVSYVDTCTDEETLNEVLEMISGPKKGSTAGSREERSSISPLSFSR